MSQEPISKQMGNVLAGWWYGWGARKGVESVIRHRDEDMDEPWPVAKRFIGGFWDWVIYTGMWVVYALYAIRIAVPGRISEGLSRDPQMLPTVQPFIIHAVMVPFYIFFVVLAQRAYRNAVAERLREEPRQRRTWHIFPTHWWSVMIFANLLWFPFYLLAELIERTYISG